MPPTEKIMTLDMLLRTKSKSRTIILLPLLIVAIAVFPVEALQAADLTITIPRTFTELDGSSLDDDGVSNGTFYKNGTLTIASGGAITCNSSGCQINIVVTGDLIIQTGGSIRNVDSVGTDAGPISILVGGNMTIQSGGSVRAENQTGGGDGGDVSITVTGNLELEGFGGTGGVISSEKLGGGTGLSGDINVIVTGTIHLQPYSKISSDSEAQCGLINLHGLQITIEGQVTASSSSTTNPGWPTGGWITIIATTLIPSGALRIASTAQVISYGYGAGADLVHLEACFGNVEVFGRVESRTPSNGVPPNHLSGTYRPGKSPRSNAGVEIWAGAEAIIDAIGTNRGLIWTYNYGHNGGTQGQSSSWIDIIASGDITLADSTSGFDFMINLSKGQTNNTGGVLTIKSLWGNIAVSGQALQTNGSTAGGEGGTISIEAYGAVNLNTATIEAKGDYVPTIGSGGFVDIRSFNNTIVWQNGTGDVRPTGTQQTNGNPLPAGNRGWIHFTKCTAGSVDVTGSVFPYNGTPTTPNTTSPDVCGGSPSFPYLSLACGPMPVELTAFTASIRNEVVSLTWKTTTETNNYGFEVQKSYDRENWRPIGFVLGYGTSNTPHQYSTTDDLDASDRRASRIYYRLKQVDRDGSTDYSPIVSVAPAMRPTEPTLFQNHPNPFNPSTNISFTLNEAQPISLIVYDTYGREVQRLYDETTLDAGYHAVTFSGTKLPSGVYRYALITGSTTVTRGMSLLR